MAIKLPKLCKALSGLRLQSSTFVVDVCPAALFCKSRNPRPFHSVLRSHVTSSTKPGPCQTWTRSLCGNSQTNPEADPTSNLSISVPLNPYDVVKADLDGIYTDIRKELVNRREDLQFLTNYYFDGQGKAVRPTITLLMAHASNVTLSNYSRDVLSAQRQIAMVSEMIHTASLVHDDVIDMADLRRGKSSVNKVLGQQKAVMSGDYIIAIASRMLARLRNEEVVIILSQVLADLVNGEFMQMGAKAEEKSVFDHYLTKTFMKTASLIAYSCKAVCALSGGDSALQEIAFQYGRNVGIAFQLVDDLLDFMSSSEQMGKPTAADLKLGLATAPVLYAAQKFPDLNSLIQRRFSCEGDVERAFQYVVESDGLLRTRQLAEEYCMEAVKHANHLAPSVYQKALLSIIDKVLNRSK